MQFCFPAPEGSGGNSSSCGIHPRGSSRFRHTAGRIRLLYEEVFRLRGNLPFFSGLHCISSVRWRLHPSRSISRIHSYSSMVMQMHSFSLQLWFTGPKVEDFGMQQIFRSLVGRGITSPRISGLCNWHMLFTSSLYINEKRCQ